MGKRIEMKAESIMAHVNMCYQRAGLPLKIEEMHFVYPTIDKNGQETLIIVDPDVQLDCYPQLWIETLIFRVKEDRRCLYQIRCKNNSMAGFEKTMLVLLDSDIFPEEDVTIIEKQMADIMDSATEFLLSTLQLLAE
jgi:hypothetical protein